jgi:hypothetical protein
MMSALGDPFPPATLTDGAPGGVPRGIRLGPRPSKRNIRLTVPVTRAFEQLAPGGHQNNLLGGWAHGA